MILQTEKLTKNFGGLTAVNRVTMEVNEGEIFGLIGPNGAGKTTFLNCVAGSYRPSSGKAWFLEENTTGEPADVMCRMGMSRTFQIPLVPLPALDCSVSPTRTSLPSPPSDGSTASSSEITR